MTGALKNIKIQLINPKIYLPLALLFYLFVAYKNSGYHHEDEHYQLIEFANYKLGLLSSDKLAWEFKEEIRPGAQPFICYQIIKAARFFGINDVYNLAFLLRAISAVFAIYVISKFVSAYKSSIRESLFPSFIYLSFFLWFVPYVNVRFSSESWSGLTFILILAIFQKTRHQHTFQKHAILGILMGIAILFRYQSALLIIGMMLNLIFIEKIKTWHLMIILMSSLSILLLGVAIDIWLYSKITVSLYNYFDTNLLQGVASQFGVSPFYQYFLDIITSPGLPIGIALTVSLIVLITKKNNSMILWALLPFLVVHSLIPHKELRFLFPLVNLSGIILILSYQFIVQHSSYFSIFRKYHLIQITVCLIIMNNIAGLTCIASTGAGSGKTSITEYLHRHYLKSNINIILIGGLNPYMDWGPPKNSFYSSDGISIKHAESIWQYDLLSLKSSSKKNLLIMYEQEITGQQSINYLKRIGLVKIYQNIPDYVMAIYRIHKITLENKQIFIYEFD